MKLTSVQITNFKGLKDIQINECVNINIFIGKNNSGKSSILHAIDIACLAIASGSWSQFQPKRKIKDLLSNVGNFEITLSYDSKEKTSVKTNKDYESQIFNAPKHPPKSILILPDVGYGMLDRRHRTPLWVIQQLENKQFQSVNALEILSALKFYSIRKERGLTPESYQSVIDEISKFFPEIDSLVSDKDEQDVATLEYRENGQVLDILYSGTGLKHFLDVLVKITISNASIVLLDEPEIGLHPDLQRKFFDYLQALAQQRKLQIFISSHSHVVLNIAESSKFFRILNNKGNRTLLEVKSDAVHTVLSDLGIRPSDLFNQDMCLLVEGASEVIFFEHIIRVLYKEEFSKIAVGIIQYGGGAAEAIVSGAIDVSNIVPSQKYLLWLRDKDSAKGESPSTATTKFCNKIEKSGFPCIVLNKREIEYYYTEKVHQKAQQGNSEKEKRTAEVYSGKQENKYRNAGKALDFIVPQGKYLRSLLMQELKDKSQLDQEIRDVIEKTLCQWRDEILGK